MKHVIIGAGVAGATAAKTIRELDKDAEVVVIGGEKYFPYKRYLLTEFLCDSVKREELNLFTTKSLKDLDIKLRKGEYVKAIDTDEKSIKLFHNEVVHYDKLLVATGGIPSLGLVLRPYKKHIQRYYSLEDILVLNEKIPDIHKCIVSGEGVSSLDLICGLTNLGKQVTCIVKGTRADFALQESELYDELHNFLEEKGVEIITEDQIVSIEKSNNHYLVETLKHNTLMADIVFAWDHYKPNISFLENTSINKESGILVNTRLETSLEDIYAAGDCVEIYHPCVNYYWINFGWPNALEQGAIAGKNMLGKNEKYEIHETTVFNLIGKSLKARWWK
ncbi:MAG: FAD-dependent oxidoreductase [Candidatus Brocadiaceae bacterium]|nr:FAD-dependent oxidoreductase [Candidatus Brocadiaceae bacterium]